jgi:uncharacterized protein
MKNFDFKIFIFVVIAISVYTIGNYYVGSRVIERIQYRYALNTKIFWITFWVIAFSYVVNRIVGDYLPAYIANPMLYIGVYYVAILSYLMLIFPLVDMIRLANRRFSFFPKDQSVYGNSSFYFTIFMGLLIGTILIYGTWSGRSTYVKAYDVRISKSLKEDLKIALLSDIHLGDYIDVRRLRNLVEEVNAMKPDIVLIAGDLVDSSIKPFVDNEMAKEIGRLTSKYGTYFSFGNHDLGSKAEELTRLLQEQGVTVLKDDYKLINDSFYVVGREDVAITKMGGIRKNLKDIIQTLDKTKPIIVIDHNPKDLSEAHKEKVDLQVSGHTHKGQFIPYNFVVNRGYDMIYGFDKRDEFNVVVSSGYGTWGPPIRIGSRSEIVKINLSSNLNFVESGVSN